MKIKYLFLVSVFGMLFFAQTNIALAVDCSPVKAGFSCVSNTTAGVTECSIGLCPGLPADIQCCKLATTPAVAPATAAATGAVTGVVAASSSTDFTNPLRFSTVEALLGSILSTAQKIIVTLALVALVIGAVLYVTSVGNEKQTTMAKDAIGAALIGLALGIAAPSLLKEISGILGWTPNDTNVNNALTLSAIAVNVLNFLLGIFGILSLIMMIIGAALYLTSAGDEDRITKGKDIFKYAVFGVLIAMAAMVLVRQIAAFFVA